MTLAAPTSERARLTFPLNSAKSALPEAALLFRGLLHSIEPRMTSLPSTRTDKHAVENDSWRIGSVVVALPCRTCRCTCQWPKSAPS